MILARVLKNDIKQLCAHLLISPTVRNHLTVKASLEKSLFTHTNMYICIYSLDPCHHDAHVAVPPRCPCPFRWCHHPSDRVHDREESLGSQPDCSRCMIAHCPNACGISRAGADRPWTNSSDIPPFCSISGRHNVCSERKLFSATVRHAHSNTKTHA